MMLRDVETHIHCCAHGLHFKAKKDMAELHPLLATTPLELIHMGFLMIEKPKNDKDVNMLIIMDHITCYTKAAVTLNQIARTIALLLGTTLLWIMGFLTTGSRPEHWEQVNKRAVQSGQGYQNQDYPILSRKKWPMQEIQFNLSKHDRDTRTEG